MGAEKKGEKQSRILTNVHMYYRVGPAEGQERVILIDEISVDLYRVKIRSEEKDAFMIQMQALVDKFKVAG